jgi:hypothetical protein
MTTKCCQKSVTQIRSVFIIVQYFFNCMILDFQNLVIIKSLCYIRNTLCYTSNFVYCKNIQLIFQVPINIIFRVCLPPNIPNVTDRRGLWNRVRREVVAELSRGPDKHPNISLRKVTLIASNNRVRTFYSSIQNIKFPIEILAHDSGRTWYVPNTVIQRDPQAPTVKEEIRLYSSQYSARLSAHPNDLIVNLIELPENRRLQRHLPSDLPTRFLV